MPKIFVRIADNSQSLRFAKQIREEVFQKEQNISAQLDFDGQDAACDQIIAFFGNEPAGCARLRYLNNKTAKLERMAVLASKRKNGIGRAILEFLIDYLKEKGITAVELHSQQHAQKFYEKIGFKPAGALFDDGTGILHIKMELNFNI